MTKSLVAMIEVAKIRPAMLPAPSELERICGAMAMLDAILSPDFEYRYYSFNCHWDDALLQRVASMQNGSGDEFFILFQPSGTILKGFAHEYPMATREDVRALFAKVPSHFSDFLNEAAFDLDNSTFCFWHEGKWEGSEEPESDYRDGSALLLSILLGGPEAYQAYAESYFLVEVPIESVRQIFSYAPLTQQLVESLNPETSIAQLSDEIAEIGYPLATAHHLSHT